MSWSFSAIGKPAAIVEKARNDLIMFKCAEPEESIKAEVLHILEISLLAYPDTSCVKVLANGSQSTTKDPQRFTNNLSVSIEQVYGFVE